MYVCINACMYLYMYDMHVCMYNVYVLHLCIVFMYECLHICIYARNACIIYASMYVCVYSFIHSGHFYSASSSPLLLRGAPDYSTNTVSEFHAAAHRQL